VWSCLAPVKTAALGEGVEDRRTVPPPSRHPPEPMYVMTITAGNGTRRWMLLSMAAILMSTDKKGL
jgi:hypothetical protein